MTITETPLKDCYIVEPRVFGDDRGFFFESFNEKIFSQGVSSEVRFVQDNHSRSSRGVLRGIHYQLEQPQGKLVRVCRGEVYDVAVDLRKSSKTFGKSFGCVLSEENKKQLWIPPGFGHGFYVISEVADFLYKTTDYYHPQSERCIIWNDPKLTIDWPILGDVPLLSPKDQRGVAFSNADYFS